MLLQDRPPQALPYEAQSKHAEGGSVWNQKSLLLWLRELDSLTNILLSMFVSPLCLCAR